MDAFNGYWKIDHAKTQNLEAFVEAAGFPKEMVKEFGERDWALDISQNAAGNLVVKLKVLNRPNLPERCYEYKLDVQQEFEGVDGDKANITISWDGSKFKEHISSQPGSPVTFDFIKVREIKDGQMVSLSTVKGVNLTEVFVRC